MTDTTPLPKLLPCPFCGREAIIIHEDRVWIECADCPSKAGVGPFDTRAEALTAWNTRSNADARLVEALRDCVALLERLYPNPASNGQINRARAALSEVPHG